MFNLSHWSDNRKPSIYRTRIHCETLGVDPCQRSLIVRGCQKAKLFDKTLFSNQKFSISTVLVSTYMVEIQLIIYFSRNIGLKKTSSSFMHCNLGSQSPRMPECCLNELIAFFTLIVFLPTSRLDLLLHFSNLKFFKCVTLFCQKFVIFFAQRNHVVRERKRKCYWFWHGSIFKFILFSSTCFTYVSKCQPRRFYLRQIICF